MQGSAYGASFAGGAFDLQSFLQLPQTILRVLSWVSHAEALASEPSQLSHHKGFPEQMWSAPDQTILSLWLPAIYSGCLRWTRVAQLF